MAFGAIGGLLHAIATVVFNVDHIVSGVAINIIAAGIAAFLAEQFFTGLPGGGPTQSPSLDKPPTITIPGLSDAVGDLADKDWFLISDAASLVDSLVTRMSVLTLIALALIFGTGWLLWKTSFGLRLRSCGESPTRGGDARCQRLPLQVHRGAGLGHLRRSRRRATWPWSPRPATRTG